MWTKFYRLIENVVKVKTGRRISIWRTFVFAKRKQLFLGRGLSYPDDADSHRPSEKSDVTKFDTEVKVRHSGRHLENR